MVKRLSDEIFRNIRGDSTYKRIDDIQSIPERIEVISMSLTELNITKSTLSDVETSETGTSSHLLYLLQEDSGIDLGLCPYYKLWYNRIGEQRRCRFNEGPVQVYCFGKIEKCENEKEYKFAQDTDPIILK